ncbi:MAG: hypothetical protein KatS3mg009_3052 [Acidimicrobiia bacterium]|nr:MAG: hypothetical protein KatS3mg009_3052 [Acidimicrobiia bacterium]
MPSDVTTVDGIAGVRARVAEIVARFQAPPVAGGVLGPGEADASAGSDFAAALARAGAPTAGAGSAPEATGTRNAAGVDPVRWAHDFLERLGMPRTAENVRAVVAWQQAEGTRARFNPLATTQGGFEGATRFNSVGVKNYASYEDGLAANVRAITNGRYGAILDALRRGDSAMAVAEAIRSSPWGSGDLVVRILREQEQA